MSSSSSKHKSQSKVKRSDSTSKSKNKKSSRSSGSSSSGGVQNPPSDANTNANSSTTQPLTIQANLNHLNSHETASPNSISREKVRRCSRFPTESSFRHVCKQNSQRSYAGLSSKTIKCIWEQYDSNEMEINGEILPVLAEDASYKLWELANVSLLIESCVFCDFE